MKENFTVEKFVIYGVDSGVEIKIRYGVYVVEKRRTPNSDKQRKRTPNASAAGGRKTRGTKRSLSVLATFFTGRKKTKIKSRNGGQTTARNVTGKPVGKSVRGSVRAKPNTAADRAKLAKPAQAVKRTSAKRKPNPVKRHTPPPVKQGNMRNGVPRKSNGRRVAPSRQPVRVRRPKPPTFFSLYWKQIVAFLIILLLLLLAIGAVYKLATQKLEQRYVNIQKPSTLSKYDPVACTADMLAFKIEYAGKYAGEPVKFVQSITNSKGKAPCYIEGGYTNMWLKVVSGDVPIWDTRSCKIGAENKPLLLDTGLKYAQSMTWNGKHAGADCKGKKLAQAGTYRAQFYLGEEKVGEEKVFELAIKPPPPQPEKTDGKKADKPTPASEKKPAPKPTTTTTP